MSDIWRLYCNKKIRAIYGQVLSFIYDSYSMPPSLIIAMNTVNNYVTTASLKTFNYLIM